MKEPVTPKLRVLMLGLRGVPDVQGGIEKHVEQLAPLLAERGCEVEIVTRGLYQPSIYGSRWRGLRLSPLWAPRSKSLETIVHTTLGVLYAAIRRPDVLHIHAIGPALLVPLARALGLKVVVTHHGQDYDRPKFGRLARWVLRLGESWGMRWASARIAVSRTIHDLLRERYEREVHHIPNGVPMPAAPQATDALESFGLQPGRYVLMVGRLDSGKRQLDLVQAFERAALDGWKLVLVGSAEYSDNYIKTLEAAASAQNIVMTGLQSGRALEQLFHHAGMFAFPSAHEGLPIALLEALSYGLRVIASDIPANLELGLAAQHYFPLKNVDALAERMREFAERPLAAAEREEYRQWVAKRYDWGAIALETYAVYEELTKKSMTAGKSVATG